MSHLRGLDVDVEGALEPINIPAYVIDVDDGVSAKHGVRSGSPADSSLVVL